MPIHDYVIDNQTAPNFRADLNNALLAIVSNNSNATAPAVTYANMMWYDTAANILYMRNEDNDAWIRLGTLDQTADTFAAAVALASQSEAEAGTDNTKVMTPLRVAQSVAALVPDAVTSQTFTTSGTYSKPAGVSVILVLAVGAGGSGGAHCRVTSNGHATGGSGGATVLGLYPAYLVPSSVTVTVGQGGASRSVSNNSGTAGLVGGTSSFGTLLSASGGKGGTAAETSQAAVTGGAGPVSQFFKVTATTQGGSSAASRAAAPNSDGPSGGGGAGSDTTTTRAGGASKYFGDGGLGRSSTGDGGAGGNGNAPGGGGGGSSGRSGTAVSGAGGRGEVRVFSW